MVLRSLKKYAVFNGRSRRKEYWMFILFNSIFTILALILDNILGTIICGMMGWIYCIYVVSMLIPSTAVAFRRFHDLGKSGLWYLIVLIPNVLNVLFVYLIDIQYPLINSIFTVLTNICSIAILLIFCIQGNIGENKYGPAPKAISKDEAISNQQNENMPDNTPNQDTNIDNM